MADIKVKDTKNKTIKTIDKGIIATERFKDTIVHTKEKAENTGASDGNIVEDGSEKIKFATNRTVDETIYRTNQIGKKSLAKTKDNFIKSKIKIKAFKNKMTSKKVQKTVEKTTKTAIKTSKSVAKNTKQVAKQSVKASQRAINTAKQTAKATARTTKAVVKGTVTAIKAIIAGTKALIAALLAGGWVALIVIIVICLIGLLCSSIFGIFFSSEDTGSGRTMNSVVTELNNEMATKISNIQKENTYDDYVIDSNRAEWKDILAVYTVKVSNGNNQTEVMTLDDNKVSILKTVFWDMNSITSEVKEEMVNEEQTENGTPVIKQVKKKILHINITSKTVDEMITQYRFTPMQKQQLNELLSEEYASLWSSVIFGTSVGSPNIVQIALSQVGNVGGQPYWSWYGFTSRVEWCACFVSWVANQAGYIDTNVIPKFSGVIQGINWFKAVGEWKEAGFVPNPGDIIFFDWENDGSADHVGIVEKVENNTVHTVEGNSNGDTCRQKEYSINSDVIFGYGTPAY